ncbi:unnamed protein product [Tetraodon nigroviridis]|uniref:(spotted green pufferfish) hypothetical protein n=1 Tax=Tetraodon nigroviridis TaxID=99883 RepID=Q4RG58_TETNG|nr:unnamed protein product [Tetraodon nigroviridis]
MGDRSNSTQDRALTVEDDITVVLQKVSHSGSDSDDDQGERTAARIHLQRRESHEHDDGDAGGTRAEADDQRRKRPRCPPGLRVRGDSASAREGRRATHQES